jgi:hypothetical protein
MSPLATILKSNESYTPRCKLRFIFFSLLSNVSNNCLLKSRNAINLACEENHRVYWLFPSSPILVTMDSLTNIILDPKYHDILAIVKGLRNGIVYGAKVRFPHAVVMTFLFKTGP